MAQGGSKLPKTQPQSGGRKKGGLTKKGKRDIAPKNRQKVEERAQKKVSPILAFLHPPAQPSVVNRGVGGDRF